MTKRTEAIKAVRDMGDDELHGHIRTQRSKLFELRFQMATGQVENHRQTREIRREIARAMTIDQEHVRGIVRVSQPAAIASAAPPAAPPRARRRRAAAAPVAAETPAHEPDAEENDVSLSEVEPGGEPGSGSSEDEMVDEDE
jgi:large subunit ribosomal protein L29